MGERGGLKELEELNKFYLHKELKKEAEMSYKGFKGYMPISKNQSQIWGCGIWIQKKLK